MSEGILGGVFSDGIKDKLKTFLKDEYQSLKLKKEIQEYLDSEQNRYLTKNEGWDYDFDVLRNTLLYYIFDETSLFNVFSEDKNTIAIEFDKIFTKCCQDSHAMGISSTEKIKSIITHCYEIVYKFHYTQESPNQLEMHNRTILKTTEAVEKKAEDVIFSGHQDTVKLAEHMDYRFDVLTDLFLSHKNNNSTPTELKSDNRYYYEAFQTSLFLDRDDSRITLKEMFIEPLVSRGKESLSSYLTRWSNSPNEHFLVLHGDAGSGKSSLVAKIVDDAYLKNGYTDKKYGEQDVLAIALREHCNLFDSFLQEENSDINNLLCVLFGVQNSNDLRDKLLILDGFDELTVLVPDFDETKAIRLIKSLSIACHSRRIKMLVTSRNLDLSYGKISNTKTETLCWTEVQVKEWCSKYSALKPSAYKWTKCFLDQYHKMTQNSFCDKRNEILCIPFILYLCCFNKIDLNNSNTVCKIYDESFRKLLMRAHTEDLIGADRLAENKTEEELRIINWQFTKEIAYQMFLIDDLTLSDVQDSNNIQYSALQLAKERTREVVYEKYGIEINCEDLQTAKLLAVFSFARREGGSGITFAHKSVCEYFTAVKLYEDYFADLNEHSFDQLSPKEQITTVLQNTIEAFRYKPIYNDIFEYLCGLCSDSLTPFGRENEKSNEWFAFDSYSRFLLKALNDDNVYKMKISEPNPAYNHLDIDIKAGPRLNRYRGGMNPHSIYMHLSRAFANLTWFLTKQGFTNSALNTYRIKSDSLFVHSNQRLNMQSWDLSSMSLREAHLEGALLSNANLSHTILSSSIMTDAKLNSSDLRRARLFSANLSYALLYHAKLDNADLRGANLSFARMRRASLSKANLDTANLKKAYLEHADLSSANLSEADLSGAKLNYANLSNSDLRGANLRGVSIIDTDFTNAIYSVSDEHKTIFPDGFDPSAHGMILKEAESD